MSWTIAFSLFVGMISGSLITWFVLRQKTVRLDQQPELRLKMSLGYQSFDQSSDEKRHITSTTLESTSLRYDAGGEMVHFLDLDIVLPARELNIEISIVDINKGEKRAPWGLF